MNVLLHSGVTQERTAREEMASQVGLAEEGFRWTETASRVPVGHAPERGQWLVRAVLRLEARAQIQELLHRRL